MVRNSGDARDEAKPDGGKALLFLQGQVGSGRILHFVARKGVKLCAIVHPCPKGSSTYSGRNCASKPNVYSRHVDAVLRTFPSTRLGWQPLSSNSGIFIHEHKDRHS
jgi:hypothetical protein